MLGDQRGLPLKLGFHAVDQLVAIDKGMQVVVAVALVSLRIDQGIRIQRYVGLHYAVDDGFGAGFQIRFELVLCVIEARYRVHPYAQNVASASCVGTLRLLYTL